MNRNLILCLLIFFTLKANCQLKNKDFEIKRDTLKSLPSSWGMKISPGFVVALDETEKVSGNTSLKIANTDNKYINGYQSFSQMMLIDSVNKLRRMVITADIKTRNVRGYAGFWYQLRDKNDKIIAIENSGQQQPIAGTNEWSKYSFNLILNRNAAKISLGGLLSGSGVVWFDNFSIDPIKVSQKPASAEVLKFSTDFNKVVKDHSIFNDSLNWKEIDEDLNELSKGLSTIDEAKILNTYVLQKLSEAGDHHSHMRSKEKVELTSKSNINPDKIEYKLLDGNIGYLLIPGFDTSNNDIALAFALEIQSYIRKLDSEHEIKGWVIDLRKNSGGNMHPMIAGLGPLTGSGTLGYFVKNDGKATSKNKWFYSKGIEGIGSSVIVKIEHPYVTKNPDNKIAVLIGPGTASSGEMTAISFIGNPHAKLFGQATLGYTSANQRYPLLNGDNLILANSYTADRNKKKYTGKIYPDVLIKDDEAVINSAKVWLTIK